MINTAGHQRRIGTYAPPGFVSHIGEAVAQVLDEAFAWYLEDHIVTREPQLGGYRFLMNSYKEGDKICLFGYSRGAYTARALAGMLCRVGLLHARNVEQVPFAFKIFKNARVGSKLRKKDHDDPLGWICENFKKTFSRNVEVEFDTVESVGLIPRRLPNTRKNKIVKHVRHALALDERRAKFQASYWRPSRHNLTNVIDTDDKGCLENRNKTIKEVWFAGGHGDVGGGWESSQETSQLSRIPLRWMIREAKECTPAIHWDHNVLEEFGVNRPKSTDTKGLTKYRDQERKDASCKSHSAFIDSSSRYFWWFLELIPLVTIVKIMDWKFPRPHLPHFGRARKIREPSHDMLTKIHSSVKTRLNDVPGYKNAATWDPKMTEFVDEWALPHDVQ
ncbi:hypothetical protein M407DRAFT_21822 [Tulasnella calospora MUT 4182]|uniref:T6SS Phospholipase effector Tle1-like catalytic domain-containing protein n=1 Tax=Tulasnella calospora MUT 4182 TaxID=1051891 RepID=A0A0C3QMI6_9AGAM|nr:hypothetical protein M407DRAFT_21822 [Tulasnella calospora MUT 4182]